jgi:prolyl oligopeptidase
LQNQSVLYRKDKVGKNLFSGPNTFSKDGTTSLGGLDFETVLKWPMPSEGSDWRKVILMDALTNKIMEDTIIRCEV